MAQADTTDTTNPPAAEKPQESLYLPTPTTPDEAFKAIGRLRREARDEIDRLIQFLDQTDNHMEREEAVDDVACDDNELELGEGDEEPSLGSHVLPSGAVSYSMPISRNGDLDCEGDEHDGREPDVDDEPSLSSTDGRCGDDKDLEADLGSFDRMMDQTKSTLTRGSWYAAEGGEVDSTL
jgi:hypothetical protein